MSLRPLAIDADAFLALRSLALLNPLVRGLAAHLRLIVTEWVNGHELSAVRGDVGALVSAGALHIEPVTKGTGAADAYREFKKLIARRDKSMRRVDLGEAETVAWALHVDPKPVFVSCDAGARAFAERHAIRTTDVLGVGVAAVRLAVISKGELADRLSLWNSPAQFVCKPAGYTTFEEFFSARWRDEAELFTA